MESAVAGSAEGTAGMVGARLDAARGARVPSRPAGGRLRWIATRIGRVPVRGELVPGPGPFEIEVLDADPRRVKRVAIHRSRPPAGRDGTRAPRAASSLAPTIPAVPSAEPATADSTAVKPPREP